MSLGPVDRVMLSHEDSSVLAEQRAQQIRTWLKNPSGTSPLCDVEPLDPVFPLLFGSFNAETEGFTTADNFIDIYSQI